jgi:hypothetical protein
VESPRKDIILFEKESLSLDVICKEEHPGRLWVRFESEREFLIFEMPLYHNLNGKNALFS